MKEQENSEDQDRGLRGPGSRTRRTRRTKRKRRGFVEEQKKEDQEDHDAENDYGGGGLRKYGKSRKIE